MIKGAIFDVDGTLLDSMSIWDDVGARYLRAIGALPEENLSEILFSMSLEEGALYMKNHYRLELPAEEIRAGVLRIIEDFYRYEVEAKSGAADFLKELEKHGVACVLATTGDEELSMAALKRMKMDEYFKKIFTCSGLGTSKRESLIYEKAAKFLGCKKNEILVFEDVLYALQSASRVGLGTVAVEDEASQKDWKAMKREADFYLKDFKDFPGFWKAMS